MAICPACGKELTAEESNGKFCVHCGKPLEAEAPVATEATPEEPKKVNAPKVDLTQIKEKVVSLINVALEKIKAIPALTKVVEKVDEKLQPVILVVVPFCLIVVLVLSILGSVIGSFTFRAPMDRYLSLINKENTAREEYIYALSPDCRDNLLKKLVAASSVRDAVEDNLDNYKDTYKDIFEAINDEFDDWKISFKAGSTTSRKQFAVDYYEMNYDNRYKTSVDAYEDALKDDDSIEDMADNYDIKETEAEAILKAYIKYYKSFDNISITEIREVKGNFVIKADKHEWTSNTVRVYFVKVNGTWAYGGASTDITFETEDEEVALFSYFFDLLERNCAVGDLSGQIFNK